MGLSGVWFAILDGLTIASGRTRQEVEQAVQRLVPQHKQPFVYTFAVHDPGPRRGARRSTHRLRGGRVSRETGRLGAACSAVEGATACHGVWGRAAGGGGHHAAGLAAARALGSRVLV